MALAFQVVVGFSGTLRTVRLHLVPTGMCNKTGSLTDWRVLTGFSREW